MSPHQFLGTEFLASGIPFATVDDLDLSIPLALLQIGYSGAQRGAGLIRVEGFARDQQALLVVLQAYLEIRHQQLPQVLAEAEELSKVTAPRKVGSRLDPGWRHVLNVHQLVLKLRLAGRHRLE